MTQPCCSIRSYVVGIFATAALLMAAPVAAQDDNKLAAACSSAEASFREYCHLIAEAATIAQPRLALALIGGNPVPGASSTLGMRLGAIPRLSVGGRVTGARMQLGPIESFSTSADEINATAFSLNVDGSLGIFTGLSLAPTIGGFGSIDLVASAGMLHLPEGDGFANDNPFSWALGARVGILRESFTAPGISITGMYRRISDATYGDNVRFTDPQSFFEHSDYSVLSVRGVVGKRILSLGANAGIGYDRVSSNVNFGGASNTVNLTVDDFTNGRTMAFGSLQFTMLVLSLIAEGGWQEGGEELNVPLHRNQPNRAQKSGYFGSFAVRLSI